MVNIAVTPFVGAWIEITEAEEVTFSCYVTPFVGAWIEIILAVPRPPFIVSLPSWERGLKLHILRASVVGSLVTPFVGAWIEMMPSLLFLFRTSVTPFVGAWIEIIYFYFLSICLFSHSLRGSVD